MALFWNMWIGMKGQLRERLEIGVNFCGAEVSRVFLGVVDGRLTLQSRLLLQILQSTCS